MKLDKRTFGRLVAHCVSNGMSAGEYEVIEIDNIIDILEAPAPPPASIAMVDELVQAVVAMVDKNASMIPAIKAYRALTGCGLVESKTTIEKHRSHDEKLSKQEMCRKLNAESFPPDVDHVIANFINKCF